MWLKFEDVTAEHPKFVFLGDYAPLCGWLWFSACCYCMRHLTDGKIELVALRRLWPYRHIGIAEAGVMGDNGQPLAEFGSDPTVEDLLERLVAAKLFDEISPGVYRVHNYLDYQLSKADITQMRRNRSKAGRQSAQQRVQHLVQQVVQHPVQHSVQQSREEKTREEVTPLPPLIAVDDPYWEQRKKEALEKHLPEAMKRARAAQPPELPPQF